MTTAATCAFGEVSRSPSYYRGEQFDSDLGLYYLRARYYNPVTGRFLSRDPEDGKPIDPKSLHKYLYAGGDPVNALDRSGRAEGADEALTTFQAIKKVLASAPAIALGIAGTLTCSAIYALDEFGNSPFSSKEDDRETFIMCTSLALFTVASGLAAIF